MNNIIERGKRYMSKDNNNFFKEKKLWSIVKDGLLGCYLTPYLQKILYTGKPTIYVDCFAGKGAFEDGSYGSPIIALEAIKKCLEKSKKNDAGITAYFIELNHADELKNNLSQYKLPSENIISGRFEESIVDLLNKNCGKNLFLYIDPYGIKGLNQEMFGKFATCNRFNSVELLINLNSFGFIREACRVLGVKFDDNIIMDDLVEYESTKLDKNQKSADILNKIAGGDYWQDIIMQKNRGFISTVQAEAKFSEEYCNRLKRYYNFVLNMPLRIKAGQQPKYRMVHATNHIDGCLLMVDNICGRWELMKDIQNNDQLSLFAEDINNNLVDYDVLSGLFIKHMQRYDKRNGLNEILADFFMENGPVCAQKDVKKIIRSLNEKGMLKIDRYPALTRQGMPSTFLSEDKNHKVILERRNI